MAVVLALALVLTESSLLPSSIDDMHASPSSLSLSLAELLSLPLPSFSFSLSRSRSRSRPSCTGDKQLM